MLRIYLDQFAWIRLARAANKLKVEPGWVEALELCRALKTYGITSFPIDIYRYWETNKNHNDGARNRLADVISELSDFDAILVSMPVLDHEIDKALAKRFGRPSPVREPRIFGRGIAHMSNGGVFNSARPADQRPPSQDKGSDFRAPIDRQLEEVLLRAGPKDHARNGLPLDAVPFGDMFVQHEVTIAQAIAAKSVKGAKLRRAVVETDLTHDIGPAIRRRMDEAGLEVRTVVDRLGDDGLVELIEDLPTRKVTNNLRTSKHLHPPANQRWEPNDFFDVIALPVPVVYCDVVMTEKQWVDSMKRDYLGDKFNTKLISTPKELSEALAAAVA
jgi:hypothetical protein